MKLFHKWNDQSHGRSVSRQTSRATYQPTIMPDWWYDPARLVARSCTICVWHHRPCCDKICSYDHPRLLRSIARFVSDLSAIHIFIYCVEILNVIVYKIIYVTITWSIIVFESLNLRDNISSSRVGCILTKHRRYTHMIFPPSNTLKLLHSSKPLPSDDNWTRHFPGKPLHLGDFGCQETGCISARFC